MKNRYILALCVVVASLGMHSCDDERYDVEGNPDNLFFLRKAPATVHSPKNSYEFNIVRTPVGGSGDEILVKLPVHSTRPVASDVSVSADVDNALIEEYNVTNGTDYSPFPKGTVNMVKSSVNFRAGSYESYDSLQISVATEQYDKFTESAYLLPIRLTGATQGKLSTSNGVILAFVNSEYKLIIDNAGVNEMVGTLVADYSGWVITSQDEPSLEYSACLDGSQDTGVTFSNVENPTIVMDMQTNVRLTGLRILSYPSRWGDYYDLSSVRVEVSKDQSAWTSIGMATLMAKDGKYQLVALYEDVEARYIRLTLAWTNGSGNWGYYYRKLHEIGVYVK